MTFHLSTLTLAALFALTACGGGGGEDAPATGGNGEPVGGEPETGVPGGAAVVQALATDGAHVLWGFDTVINGAPQVFIGKETLQAGGTLTSTKIAGATASAETAPSLLDVVPGRVDYLRNGTLVACVPRLSFAASTTAASLTCGVDSAPSWSVTLTPEDVSGKPVAGHVRNAGGEAVGAAVLDTTTVFAAGSIAYTTDAVATAEVTVFNPGNALTSNNSLIDKGWCQEAPGAQTLQLGVLPRSGGSVEFYQMPAGACDLSGLTPIAVSYWTPIAPGTSYRLVYPDAIRNDMKWQGIFTGATTPTRRAFDVVLVNGTTSRLGNVIAGGEHVKGLQPFFNTAAVSSLKAAAKLP